MCTLNIYDGLIDDLTDYVNYGLAVVDQTVNSPPAWTRNSWTAASSIQSVQVQLCSRSYEGEGGR